MSCVIESSQSSMSRFVIIDIETPYSLNVEDGIREVAAIVVDNGNVVDSLHLAIITDPEEYENGYGAGLEAIEKNETFLAQFRSFIHQYDYPLVAHFAQFDKRFLCHWSWIEEDHPVYCSLRAIRKEKPGLPSYSMGSLLAHFGFEKGQKHTALQDVADLLELLRITKPRFWVPVGVDYDPEYEKQLTEERRRRLETAKNNPVSELLNGKKVVFTGKMAGSRIEMMEIAVKHGGEVADSVSKKTDLLVVGEDAGSKLSKAQALNIPIIAEKDFWKLIGRKQ